MLVAGNQSSVPLVDFRTARYPGGPGWESVVSPPGRLLDAAVLGPRRLGISRQSPW